MKNIILKIIDSVPDETYKFNERDIEDGKDMGVLCYIMPLLPYFLNKKNKYVKYHSIVGMNLFVLVIFYYIIFKIINPLCINLVYFQVVLSIIWLIILILSCIGISNVCSGKARKLPFINKIEIFK